MTQPRSPLVSLEDTSWYHCVCRCVRRAFLYGEDRLTGQNYDHRRGWIAERMKGLAQVFAIDIACRVQKFIGTIGDRPRFPADRLTG